MTDKTSTYQQSDFAAVPASQMCDIIMKGGITSGVVYPLAICELAKKYRFANIGGTSAGAIAAAAAAAAEYGRMAQSKGFMRLAALPEEAGRILLSLFQPSPELAPLFRLLLAGSGNAYWLIKAGKILAAALMGFWFRTLLCVVVALVLAYAIGHFEGPAGVALAVVLGLLGAAAGIASGVLHCVLKELPNNKFGMCPGIRQPGHGGPGFTDWLADLIDDAAGRDTTGDPLTFGHLDKPPHDRPKINLQMMTTNLMQKRPHTLPLEPKTFYFKLADFEKIFPTRVVKYLIANCKEHKSLPGESGEFYHFPERDKLPLVVAARMSLSFPILICAVPLYTHDDTLDEKNKELLQECLFSDGGLSSNFPIHFFDRMLPSTPTFGISLDQYDERRNHEPTSPDGRRVWMPETTRGGILVPIEGFSGIGGFFGRLLDAAKDWQDTLQGTLTGYRERVVHVCLKPDEGGLNIAMPKELVSGLADLGQKAGKRALSFDFDEHRWRRFLVAVERLDETVADFGRAYQGLPPAESFEAFLARYPEKAHSYANARRILPKLLKRTTDLHATAASWAELGALVAADFPHPKTDLRIRPKP